MQDIRQQFRDEGLSHIYEWTDKPNTEYPEHAHKGRVSFFVTKGSIVMNIAGEEKLVQEGERIDVPVGVSHAGKVGPIGCAFIVGEEIEGDS